MSTNKECAGVRKIFFMLDADGLIESYSSTSFRTPKEIEIELPEDHELFYGPPFIFRYVDGEIVKDTGAESDFIHELEDVENKPSLEEENKMLKEQINNLEDVVLTMLDMAITM